VGDLVAILGLIGKRDIEIPKRLWDDLFSQIQNGVIDLAESININ
jgi:hypothetical protein